MIFVISTLQQILLGDQMKDDKMDRKCSPHGEDDK
jgi:hypothetical protein